MNFAASGSGRKRTPSGRSPRTSSFAASEKHRRVESSQAWRGKDRPARRSSRPQSRGEKEKEKDYLRLQRILALDDHAEQTKRFLELMGVKVEDVLDRGSRGQVRVLIVLKIESIGNYLWPSEAVSTKC